jgi:outer membrane protein
LSKSCIFLVEILNLEVQTLLLEVLMRRFLLILLICCSPPALAQTAFTLEEGWKALPQSTAWRAADNAFLIAERNLNAARAAAGLTVTVGGDVIRNQISSSDAALNGTALTASVNAQASIAVLPWSAVFDGVRGAQRNLERVGLDLKEARAGLQLQFLTFYAQAQLAQTDAVLAAQNLVFAAKKLQITKAQLEAGTATNEAVLSAEASLRSGEANVKAADNAKRLTAQGVFVFLGIATRATVFSSLIAAPKLGEINLEVLVKSAKNFRPDVLRAILAVQQAQDDLEIAKRDRWVPNLGLNAGVNGVTADGKPTGTQLSTNLNLGNGALSVQGAYAPSSSSNATALTLSLQISIPIVAPTSDARVGTAEAALNAVRLNLETVNNSAELEVQNKFFEREAAIAGQDVAQANLDVAKRRTTDNTARLAVGLITSLELVQSEILELQTTRELQNAGIQAALSGFRLLNAVKPLELVRF